MPGARLLVERAERILEDPDVRADPVELLDRGCLLQAPQTVTCLGGLGDRCGDGVNDSIVGRVTSMVVLRVRGVYGQWSSQICRNSWP